MEINKLFKINYLKILKNSIVFTKKTKIWCQLPYPNHPNGCPNYKNNPICPPKVKYMDFLLIEYSHFYLIYAEFDLKAQRERMLKNHPNWSNKQANCLLYWQNSVKKALKDYIQNIIILNKEKDIFVLSCGSGFKFNNFNQKNVYSMEAVGINVIKTLRNVSIPFEIKPKNKVILVTLLSSQVELSF